jgi:transitional endoplasmic reticulum ATPase
MWKLIPISIFTIKDYINQIIRSKNFHDSLVTSFAFLSMGIAFPFLPPLLFLPLLILVLVSTYIHPLMGLMSLMLLTLPELIYQAPLLAWFSMMLISISLMFGYRNYRSISYAYALAALPLSPLGLYLEIPALMLSCLVLGFKRSAIMGSFAILLSITISALAGIPLSGPISYNTTAGHARIMELPSAQYYTASRIPADYGNVLTLWGNAFSSFIGLAFGSQFVLNSFGNAVYAIAYNLPFTALQILLWIFISFGASSYALRSRSSYKGFRASFFGIFLPLSSYVFAIYNNIPFDPLIIISFVITPIIIFIMETLNIDVVMALDVMKQDILGKFGVAFEDLTMGSNETLDDVANYSQTKQELKETIMGPIEHREIAGAYKVQPAKGVLLFGPPGTGKTLIMRALANEIRAGFFYVKGSSIISPYPGESSQAISRIFATAKKHSPCVLFFDEIDAIAGRREMQEGSTGRELVTALLSEMDGFQKISGVIIVGATNVPQLLDSSIMRPGRFDKIIYMPLPDQDGRKLIFKHYLAGLPVSKDIAYDQLANLTARFSPADIKNVCEEVSREVGDAAVAKHEVLVIKMADVMKVLKAIKPSTSLARMEEYNTFRLDYERRARPEEQKETEKKVSLEDVIGLDDAKKALREAVEIPILHPELIKKYDIGNIKGILLFGPPGTGKTMLMQAVANELGDVRVLSISGYDIAKYGQEKAGVTIKEIFDRAKENAPAIVFLDEIDALVPSRDNANENGLQLTGEVLQEFDRIKQATGVVVVAATNRPDVLDPALLRAGRFDRLIFMPAPDVVSREKIFELNLEKAPLAADIDFKKLASVTEGYTGADIANVCRQAKMNALESSLTDGKETQINTGDLLAMIQKARPSAPGIVMGRYLTFFGKYGKR